MDIALVFSNFFNHNFLFVVARVLILDLTLLLSFLTVSIDHIALIFKVDPTLFMLFLSLACCPQWFKYSEKFMHGQLSNDPHS